MVYVHCISIKRTTGAISDHVRVHISLPRRPEHCFENGILAFNAISCFNHVLCIFPTPYTNRLIASEPEYGITAEFDIVSSLVFPPHRRCPSISHSVTTKEGILSSSAPLLSIPYSSVKRSSVPENCERIGYPDRKLPFAPPSIFSYPDLRFEGALAASIASSVLWTFLLLARTLGSKRGRNVGRQAQTMATSTSTTDQTQGSTSDPGVPVSLIA